MIGFALVPTQRKACTCMILVRDGEKMIRNALDSAIAARCFSEILVSYDTRTRDRTGAILAEYQSTGAPIRIIPYNWSDPPDFAAARNHSIYHVKTPYAFWLDADEIIAEPDKLRTMLRRANGQAFSVWVVSPMSDGSNFNMYQPRLFPITPGVFFECPVFERLDWSLKRQGIQIEQTPYAVILHPGYQDGAELAKKNRRNVRILERALRTVQGNEQRQHLLSNYRKLKN